MTSVAEYILTQSVGHEDLRQDERVMQLFSLVNDPRNEYNRLLTVDRLGNVVGGIPVRYVNVKMEASSR